MSESSLPYNTPTISIDHSPMSERTEQNTNSECAERVLRSLRSDGDDGGGNDISQGRFRVRSPLCMEELHTRVSAINVKGDKCVSLSLFRQRVVVHWFFMGFGRSGQSPGVLRILQRIYHNSTFGAV